MVTGVFVDVATSTISAEVSITDPPPPPGTVDGSDEVFWGAELDSEPCKGTTGAGTCCELLGGGTGGGGGGGGSDMGRGKNGWEKKHSEVKKYDECNPSNSIIDCQGRVVIPIADVLPFLAACVRCLNSSTFLAP